MKNKKLKIVKKGMKNPPKNELKIIIKIFMFYKINKDLNKRFYHKHFSGN